MSEEQEAIQNAVKSCLAIYEMVIKSGGMEEGRIVIVTKAADSLGATINEMVPDSADKSAALRCLRLSHTAAIAAIQASGSGGGRSMRSMRMLYERMAEMELIKAGWQASWSVA